MRPRRGPRPIASPRRTSAPLCCGSNLPAPGGAVVTCGNPLSRRSSPVAIRLGAKRGRPRKASGLSSGRKGGFAAPPTPPLPGQFASVPRVRQGIPHAARSGFCTCDNARGAQQNHVRFREGKFRGDRRSSALLAGRTGCPGRGEPRRNTRKRRPPGRAGQQPPRCRRHSGSAPPSAAPQRQR